MLLKIFTDGGARGNPGPGGIGVVFSLPSGEVVLRFGKPVGIVTNNIAEYLAVEKGLELLPEYLKKNSSTIKRVEFYLDSLLVVNQINGLFKVKNGDLQKMLLRIRSREASLTLDPVYKNIPREKNEEADQLVNEVLDRGEEIFWEKGSSNP